MQFNRSNTAVDPIRIPVKTYHDVYLGAGFKVLLAAVLFPNGRDTAGGNKVTAIKAVRAELGCGLKEAKDLVDAMTPELLGGTPAHPASLVDAFKQGCEESEQARARDEAQASVQRHFEADTMGAMLAKHMYSDRY